MGFILKILITATAAIIAAYFLPGVTLDGLVSALIVGLILSLLNAVVKPVLIVLTIPITILTLGLFLLIINALLVRVTDYFVEGFAVSGWGTAILFALIVSVVTYILDALADKD
jgi:putative membrane protein